MKIKVREMIEPVSGFFEIYVSTPIEVCEQRGRKGLYAKARTVVIKEFTGVSDPYEPPEKPELTIATETCMPDGAVDRFIHKLRETGYFDPAG